MSGTYNDGNVTWNYWTDNGVVTIGREDGAYGGATTTGTDIAIGVTIPTAVITGNGDLVVTKIGNNAFRGCTTLTSVSFENDSQLVTIGDRAFFWAQGLSGSITLPASLTSIGNQAFQNCSSLTSVSFELGSQLETIGEYAFPGSGLSGSITLPASLTSIGQQSFFGLSNLTSVIFESGSLTASGSSIGDNAFASSGLATVNAYLPLLTYTTAGPNQSFYGATVTIVGLTLFTNSELVTAVNEWFANEANATTTYGHMSSWNVTGVTLMRNLFKDKGVGAAGVQTIPDLSGWDVSNVVSMQEMFKNANTTGINIGNWDVSNVDGVGGDSYGMTNMFEEADLTGIGQLNWDVSKVKRMTNMFKGVGQWWGSNPDAAAVAKYGGNIDVSLWTGAKAPALLIDTNSMFHAALGFNSEVPFGAMPNLTNSWRMFAGCISFNNGDSGNNSAKPFNWTNIGNATSQLFDGCIVFNQDLSSIDVSNITNFTRMFFNCSLLDFNFHNTWEPAGPTFYHMFGRNPSWFASELHTKYGTVGGALYDANFGDTPQAAFFQGSMYGITFVPTTRGLLNTAITAWCSNDADTSSYNNVAINNWDTSQIDDMSSLFEDKINFNDDISGWDTSNVTTMRYMFKNCTAFNKPVDFNTTECTMVTSMFENCTAFNSSVTFSSTDKIDNYNNMFKGCSIFNQALTFAPRTTPPVHMEGVFQSCTAFNNNDQILTWDTQTVVNMKNMFKDAIAFNQEIRGWDVSSVSVTPPGNFVGMFDGATLMNAAPYYAPATPTAAYFVAAFKPANKADLQTAVDEWCLSPRTIPGSYYGYDISDWDTSEITDMLGLFKDKATFNDDISAWNTSNVTDMESMFKNCIAFNKPLTFSDTSKVKNMWYMMAGCTAFNSSITLDTSKVENLDHMFDGCTAFNKPVDFNTSACKTVNNMFENCTSFNSLVTFSNTSTIGNYSNMFKGCSVFNNNGQPLTFAPRTTNVVEMESMFQNAIVFDQEIRVWNVTEVTNFLNMFNGATAMNAAPYYAPDTPTAAFFNFTPTNANIQAAVNAWCDPLVADTSSYLGKDITIWDTSNVTNMSNLFSGKTNFNDDISAWDTSKVTHMGRMFFNAAAFNQPLDFDTSSVTNMYKMFAACTVFNQTLTFTTSSVTTMQSMFAACPAFNKEVIFNTSSVINMGDMFYGCSAFNSTVTFSNTSKVESMQNMFSGCSAFNKALDFNTSSVINMGDMFKNCIVFNQTLTFSDTSKVESMAYMFQNCSAFDQPLTFNTSKVTNMNSMFRDATVFSQEIRDWNVTSVTNFTNMFNNAAAMIADYGAQWDGPATFFTMPYAPIITILGPSPMYIEITVPEASFTDPGATATDHNSPPAVDVTSAITGPNGATSINESIEGLYQITYTATNTDINFVGTTTAIRKVHVYTGQVGIPVCFPKGTPVLTNLGPVAIEKLNPDQHTICDKEIVAITQTRPLQKHIVCFEKDSLINNIPSQKTLCSKEHKISYQGEMTKARDLVDLCENVTFVQYNGETLYNVLLKQHDTMMINNMKCETLHPENIAAKISTMKDGQKKNKIICELNKIIKENNIPEYQKLYTSL